MTIEEFFEKLPRDGWKLDGHYIVRHRRIGGYNVCPIASLARLRMTSGKWQEAAIEIGLSRGVAKDIITAADYGNAHLSKKHQKLRARLLEHCGLVEAQ